METPTFIKHLATTDPYAINSGIMGQLYGLRPSDIIDPAGEILPDTLSRFQYDWLITQRIIGETPRPPDQPPQNNMPPPDGSRPQIQTDRRVPPALNHKGRSVRAAIDARNAGNARRQALIARGKKYKQKMEDR